MSNKVISIEIGLHTTKICEVDFKKKNPHVYSCIIFQTPENTFEDGYIRDKNKFVLIVKDKIKEANMRSNRVVFTVASTKIANREVILPLIKDNRIQDVINANASDYFPVDISQYIITYSILQKIITKEEKKLRLLVLAAPDNLIKNYYNVAEMMGYEVVAIDYIGNSSYQIIKKQVGAGTNLVIQMNEQTTLISILEDDILGLQRTLSYGTTSVINTIVGNEVFHITNDNDAIQLLCSKELINPQLDSFQSEAAASLSLISDEYKNIEKEKIGKEEVTDSLRDLISNILRVLDYYYSKNKEKKINSIYITGQGSKFKGIDSLLHHETGIEVKKLDKLQSVAFNKNINLSSVDESDYISCIGATINPIHFVPKEYSLKDKKKTNIHSIKVIFATSFIVSAILVSTSILSYKTALIDNASLTNDIANLEDINKIYDASVVAQDSYTKVIDMYDMTANPNDKLNNLLTELQEKLPTEVIVQTMSVTSTDITLGFKGDSKQTAAKVLQQLKTFTSISQVSTGGITETEDENGFVTVQFIVTASYTMEYLQEDSNGGN